MRAVQITRFGGPEVLDVVDLPDPTPGEGQQLFHVSTAGVNYADTHQIENSYLAAQQLPLVPGAEFVGTPAGGGPRVVGLLDGGGYAEKVVAHPRLTWQVPDGVTDEQALAVVLQGSTAYHLLRTSAHLAAGETVVVIAGAGGVGSLAVQLAAALGRGPGHRDGVQPGEAGTDRGARRRRLGRPGPGRRRPEGLHRCAP
jgi:NADPH:quinone reductase and related Zn-dependent oxidoreductases